MKRLLKGPWVVFFVAAAFILISACAVAPPAKEEAKAVPPKEEGPTSEVLEWASEADGVAKDGVITRKSPPAFIIDYPGDFVVDKRQEGEIIRVKGAGGLPVFNIGVGKFTGDKKSFLASYAEGYKKALEDIGTGVEILYNKPLPPDTYWEEFPAQEFEIEWMYAGTTLLTSYVHLILKENYYIALQGHVMGDIDKLKMIYETIDLEPLF